MKTLRFFEPTTSRLITMASSMIYLTYDNHGLKYDNHDLTYEHRHHNRGLKKITLKAPVD